MWSRDAILALRLAGAKLSLQVQQSMAAAGCLRRLRGCRAGRLVQSRRQHSALCNSETETPGNIPVIISTRRQFRVDYCGDRGARVNVLQYIKTVDALTPINNSTAFTGRLHRRPRTIMYAD